MLKKLSLALALSSLAFCSMAQSINVSGVIKDTTADKFVHNAVVALLSPQDSTLLRFTRTSETGNYNLPGMQPGKYIFVVMHPTFADYVEDMDLGTGNQALPMVAVTPKSKLLEAIILQSGNPIRIKGDTTIYTADSFKVSANANVEELLKKMPGIQVDKNGQIKAMGETVEKVLVDGEEFFGDDPGMAVKNLRADAVKEVQVFKKKSDQAEFTGIDDGESKQTINLKLKEDRKTGYFGKVDASGGLQPTIADRYNSNLMFSTFKGKRKLSAFLLNGNTGQDGLSWQDMEKYGGTGEMNMELTDDGGMMFFSGGGSSDEEPYVNTENGFIKNTNAGLQYSNKWNDTKTLNFSPKFNSQLYDNNKLNFTQTRIGDSLLNENASTNTNVDRYNFKTNASYEIKIDTNNTLKLTLAANIYHTESDELRRGNTTGASGNLINSSDRKLATTSDKESYAGTALFKHRFKKPRRTLSLNASWNILTNDAMNYLQSDNQTFEDGLPVFNQQQNQLRDIERQTQVLSSKVVYTEPLNKDFSLELGHEISLNKGINNQVTYTYSNQSGKYDVLVDSLTNDFDQTISINKPSVKISYSSKKIKYNFGSGFGITHFNLKDKTTNRAYIRDFTNIFPQANFTYTYKSNHSLRFTYNGNTRQPTISQLQPLTNNNDYFTQYLGNPDLKPSFTNSFNLSHNGYNFMKERWMYQSVYLRLNSNAITNDRVINPVTGQTTIRPINTDGNFTIGMWSGMGLKLKKLKTQVNVDPNFNYSRFADVINSKTSYSNNFSGGLRIGANKSKDKKFDVGFSNNFNFNSNKTSQSNETISFITNEVNVSATVYYKKVWSINSNYDYYYRQKTPQFSNSINNNLWNARLQRTFKKNEFTAYFTVRDILNQNVGITRSFYSNTLMEETNDRLKRYWMLGFTWDFKNKTSAKK